MSDAEVRGSSGNSGNGDYRGVEYGATLSGPTGNAEGQDSDKRLIRAFIVITLAAVVVATVLFVSLGWAPEGSASSESAKSSAWQDRLGYSQNGGTARMTRFRVNDVPGGDSLMRVEGFATLPAGAILNYEVHDYPAAKTQEDGRPLVWYRAATVMGEDGQWAATFPLNTWPDATTYMFRIAYQPEWQQEQWLVDLFGPNGKQMSGPSVYTDGVINQLMTADVVYREAVF